MNAAEPARVVMVVAAAVALAFAGLHAALTASSWFVAYIVLPLLKGQESLRTYLVVAGHVAYVAVSMLVGVALAYAAARHIWLGLVAFLVAVAVLLVDWKQEGGSYLWAIADVPAVVFVGSALGSAYVARRMRRTRET